VIAMLRLHMGNIHVLIGRVQVATPGSAALLSPRNGPCNLGQRASAAGANGGTEGPMRIKPSSLTLAFAVGLRAVLAVVLAGCVVIPAKATVTRSGQVQAASGGLAVAVLFSRDFSPDMPKGLGDDIVKCVTRGLRETAPKVRLVSEEDFDQAVFGVKPGEVLLRRETIKPLLARSDIRERIRESHLTHLILVEGATRHDPGGSSSGPVTIPYVWVGAWGESTRRTQFIASIVDLEGRGDIQVQANSQGSQGAVTGIPLPLFVGWVHATESASCEALGAEVARALGAKPQGGAAP
jgi:hypothetical protein